MEIFVLAVAIAAVVVFFLNRKKPEQDLRPASSELPKASIPRPYEPPRPGKDQPMKVIKFNDNRPPGDWVNWKIYSGWFEVAGTHHREREVLEFLSAAEIASRRGRPFGVELVTDSENQHDPNAIKVVGSVAGKNFFIGFVPRDISNEVAKMPSAMPIAAELKQAKIGHSKIIVSVAGLIPPAKVRREKGCDLSP